MDVGVLILTWGFLFLEVVVVSAEIIDQGPLTDREAEVARLMTEGHADKVIAKMLDISYRTVNAHAGNIYVKLQIHSTSAVANTAAINCRCWAISQLIARGLIGVSIKLMSLVLIFNVAQVDDELLRLRSGQARVKVSASRLRRDA